MTDVEIKVQKQKHDLQEMKLNKTK